MQIHAFYIFLHIFAIIKVESSKKDYYYIQIGGLLCEILIPYSITISLPDLKVYQAIKL